MSVYSKLVESLLEANVEGQTKSNRTSMKDVEQANRKAADAEPEPETEVGPERARKADALKATGRGRGRQLGRVVRGAGDKGSLARRLAGVYARSLAPGSRDKIQNVRDFRKGVDTIGSGIKRGTKKFLRTGKNIPTGGPLI